MNDQEVYVKRCIIVSAETVIFARYLAGRFGDSSKGMFTAALGPADRDTAEPTHFISEGYIGEAFAGYLASPENLVAGVATFGEVLSLELAHELLDRADVSQDEPFVALARLGLKLWAAP